MRRANAQEIELFKVNYCKNEQARISMKYVFNVQVESFETLLPQKQIHSYATGERHITDSFIMFHVYDNTVEYFPVFSESTGRTMLNAWGMAVPPKRSIFIEDNSVHTGKFKEVGVNRKPQATVSNIQMKTLILFSYSLMILHTDSPTPMGSIFRTLYQRFEQKPTFKPFASEIGKVNSALRNFLQNSPRNTAHENFQTLQDYIEYLHSHFGEKKLRNTDFQQLRDIMKAERPEVQLYF